MQKYCIYVLGIYVVLFEASINQLTAYTGIMDLLLKSNVSIKQWVFISYGLFNLVFIFYSMYLRKLKAYIENTGSRVSKGYIETVNAVYRSLTILHIGFSLLVIATVLVGEETLVSFSLFGPLMVFISAMVAHKVLFVIYLQKNRTVGEA